MASDIHNCLVCFSVIFPIGNIHLDKEEALFLIKIILEIPEYTQLIYPVESSLNSLPVCKPCSNSIKQCIQIYTQISAQVHQFWRVQSDILSKVTKETDHHNNYNNWVDQCRNFVKHRNFTTFKYPFVFHGFPKLPTSIPDSTQFINPFTNLSEPLSTSSHPENLNISSIEDPLEGTSPTSIEISDTFQFKQEYTNSTKEIEFENEYEDNVDNDEDYDISDPEESSEEDETPSEPDFKWNPITGKFHCLEHSCSKTAALKRLIERHYRNEHFTKNLALKKTYHCDWPSCGKIFKKQSNHLFHMDKHRGTPSLKCGKCENPFYYPRGLRFHQTRNCDMAVSSQIQTTSQDSISIPKLKRFVRNSKTGKYHCHYHLCTQSFFNRHQIRDHAIMHERTKRIPNQDVTRYGYPNIHNLESQPSPILPISNVQLPVITRITSHVLANTVQNNDHFNYFEENSLSRSDPLDNLPSSSGSSLRSPFVAESEALILNGIPAEEFENEDDEHDSDEDYELSEDSEEYNNHPQKSTKKQCYTTSTCTWPNCGKIFTRKENYECHMNLHRGTPSLKCKPCGKLFYWRRCLIDHQKTTPSCQQIEEESPSTPSTVNQEDNKKGYKCTWKGCRKIFARKTNYESHMTVHKGTPTLKCKRCGKLFYWKRALHQHQNSKDCKPSGLSRGDDNEYMDGFTCTWPGCGIRLSNQTRLRDHMDRHRGTPKQRCEECAQLFYWRADLISHRKKEHKNQADKAENIQLSNTNSDDRILSRIPTMSPSDDLGTTRSSSKPRTIIVKIIEESKEKNNESDYKVETQSSEEFEDEDSNPSNSNESTQETNQGHSSRDMELCTERHTEDDFRQDPITARFHCSEPSCTKSSISKSYINRHYEVEHLKSKEKESFSCDWPGCGKVIGDKQTWRAHMDKHKGTPQFECDECGKTFYWRKGYLKHKGKDHGRKQKRKL